MANMQLAGIDCTIFVRGLILVTRSAWSENSNSVRPLRNLRCGSSSGFAGSERPVAGKVL